MIQQFLQCCVGVVMMFLGTDSIGGVTIVIPKTALTIRANTKKVKEKVQEKVQTKPKRTISSEHLAKLQAGRRKKVQVQVQV
jgi:hypothetical protein